MTKAELIDAIAAGVEGLTKAKAEQALNVTLNSIMEAVAPGRYAKPDRLRLFQQG